MLSPVDNFSPILPWLDAFGILMFAASGTIAAVRARQTFVTAAFFALMTGVGGGTLRDLLIDAPVFWVVDPWIALICLGGALVIWITPERWWAGQGLDWLDAIGLASYAVFGAAKSLGMGVPPVPAMLMGVVTACVGGIIRDVVAGEPSILMRPELYVTAAALASALYVGLRLMGFEGFPVATIAAGAGFALRAAAIRWKLGLPAYRGRQRG
ncbi:trimeric intracellular cation channel family protein [Sphingomonas sp.]|uniref:trimeric intracellular cation channel family protein n=1 Tax=Sphingomonas sp. TaxID=28214 RepID=UPI002CF14C51|nr:trimeric intracellular cation channel family protein [Sphingomonas sp.]HTG39942.1 trimeric intracellular cation channel family protein [Sphingomonas sp.]